MSKFKVGDKVIYNGVHDEIDEIVYVGGKFFGYDLIINNIWPVKEKYLKPYKTPHQELLDLGWELVSESEIYVNYTMVIDTKTTYLTFDKLLRRYKTWITYTHTGDKVPAFVSKTEAKLFARYLDYMVNWREFIKEELE